MLAYLTRAQTVIHIVLKLRNLSATEATIVIHEEWRHNLCIAMLVNMQIKHEIDERSLQTRAQALVHHKSRARHL